MPREPEPKSPAPYMSYGVFTRTIDALSSTTVPTGPLDRRVLHELSGADYGSLMSGLRFLGLIDDENRATAEFRNLVVARKDTEKFKTQLLGVITPKYMPIVGKLDLKQGTLAELEAAFKKAGVASGQMLTKTIRFFLKAYTECGFPFSPHITEPKPRARSAKRTKPKKPTVAHHPKGISDGTGKSEDDTPTGFERLPLPGMPNSFIQYPANLTDAQCAVFEAMVGVLRTGIKARTGGKGNKQ